MACSSFINPSLPNHLNAHSYVANSKIYNNLEVHSDIKMESQNFKIINRTNRTVRLVNVRCDFCENLR